MSLPAVPPSTPRHCFVTVGATVTFSALLSTIKTSSFLLSLTTLGFTHLTVQCGSDFDSFARWAEDTVNSDILTVECFDLKDSLMGDMALCRKEDGRELGIVLSHAGTGSVLDAMAANVPMVVIPNESLLDNHQLELARMVESRKYGIAGTLLTLASDIQSAHNLYTARQEASVAKSIASQGSGGRTFWDMVNSVAFIPKTSTSASRKPATKEVDSVMVEG